MFGQRTCNTVEWLLALARSSPVNLSVSNKTLCPFIGFLLQTSQNAESPVDWMLVQLYLVVKLKFCLEEQQPPIFSSIEGQTLACLKSPSSLLWAQTFTANFLNLARQAIGLFSVSLKFSLGLRLWAQEQSSTCSFLKFQFRGETTRRFLIVVK